MNAYTKSLLREDIEFSYTPEGLIEILISPRYGSGWSTWNENNLSITLDKRIIDYFKEKGNDIPRKDVEAFLESIGYYEIYVGGWKNLKLKTVEKGIQFLIREHDGWETLEVYEPQRYFEL